MEIREHLDRSFGEGPTQRPVIDHLVSGRRALRRRRAAAGVAALAVIGLVGGTSWMATGGTGDESGNGADRVATAPSAETSNTPKEQSAPKPPSKSDFLGNPALLRDGTVFFAKGWREVSRVENPMDYPAPNKSLGLEVRKGEEHEFVLLCEFEDGTSTDSGAAVGTLDDWLETAVANQHTLDVANGVAAPDKVNGPLVTMDATGRLTARSDLKIVAQVSDVDLGPNFSGPDDPTAAARLDMPTGRDIYVVVRRIAGSEAEVIRGGNAGTFPTLGAFITHARNTYSGDSNEGLR